MITQDQQTFVAEIRNEARPFVGAHGNAFEVVIRDHSVQLCRIEIVVDETRLRACDGKPCRCMRVHHAMRIGQRAMNRGMHDEARRIHGMRRSAEHIPVDIDPVFSFKRGVR